MKIKNIILVFLAWVCIQCSKKNTIEKVAVEPAQIIELIDFPDIAQYQLTCTDSELIATDSRTNTVHIFDYETLEIVESFGGTGRGPGEFTGAMYSFSDEEYIYVSNSGNQSVSVFNRKDSSYHSEILQARTVSRFVGTPDYIYLSSPYANPEVPFLRKERTDTGEDAEFGKGTGNDFFARNIFNLLPYQDYILAVSHSEPTIHLYDLPGNQIWEQNIEDNPNLNETMNFVHQFYAASENNNRTVTLFNDASVTGDFLILNLYSRKEGQLKTNDYLVYKIKEIGLDQVMSFETNIGIRGITSTFCVHNNQLFSNGGEGGIDMYVFDLDLLF